MFYNPVTALIILDGLGISNEKRYNAFYQAKTPHLTLWQTQHSYTQLHASGLYVGLPDNYNGNSEVGHFTLGSGRIAPQTSTLLNINMQKNILYSNTTLAHLLKNFNLSKRIHLAGLLSDGNVHSNLEHARALIYAINHHGFSDIVLHAFLDGRDTAPKSAQKYIDVIDNDFKTLSCGKIASIHGRYYAMDRNKNWDRTDKSFEILTQKQNTFFTPEQILADQYAAGITDEFIRPTACIADHTIKPGDAVIFFNFRPDRAIQLTEKLLGLDLGFFITPVVYHEDVKTTPLIPAVTAQETLLPTLAAANKTIFTVAETEKYAHVTYFFNGHQDITIANETRVLIPSDQAKEPADNPTMQAEKITQTIIESLQKDPKDFYLVNYANADMVGHSGNLPATIKAIEYLDEQLGILYDEIVIKRNGTVYITADHGNAEEMFLPKENQPCTSHTNNKVPFYMLSNNDNIVLNLQSLADVAPFILENMKIKIPACMTGTKL